MTTIRAPRPRVFDRGKKKRTREKTLCFALDFLTLIVTCIVNVIDCRAVLHSRISYNPYHIVSYFSRHIMLSPVPSWTEWSRWLKMYIIIPSRLECCKYSKSTCARLLFKTVLFLVRAPAFVNNMLMPHSFIHIRKVALPVMLQAYFLYIVMKILTIIVQLCSILNVR